MKALFAILLIASPLFANAYTTWDQTINFNPDPLVKPGSSFTFTHDLTSSGFEPLSDIITSYNLSVDVYDDNNNWLFDGIFETVVVNDGLFGGGVQTFAFNWVSGTVDTTTSFLGLITLNLLGELNVTVSSATGDFYLASSTLTAKGYGTAASVPEPSSLALLAAGLLGIAAMRRSAGRNS